MTVRDIEVNEYAKVRLCFLEAITLVDAERRQYLDKLRKDTPEIAGRVEKLVEHHEGSADMLDTGIGLFSGQAGDLKPGDRVGRFEIVRLLGHGGMGAVYEARNVDFDERVALKTILPELVLVDTIRERFRDEILNGKRVAHKNLCRIHDFVAQTEENTPLAFTMELLEGETLAERLERDGKLSPEETLPLARQLAEGLEALHEHSIVHRDLKPANVFITKTATGAPRVKITDFGLARRQEDGVDPDRSIGVTGAIAGTPAYMAPEQLRADRKNIGPATDVYALGLALYEMVTGERPFPASGAPENLLQKLQTSPKPPSALAPALDKRWDRTILACLTPQPKARPPSPVAVVEMLEGAQEPPRAARKPLPWKLWGAVAAVISILLALSILGSRVQTVAEPEQLRVAVLPFQVMSSDEDLSAYADGLMQRIARGLTRFEGLNESLVVMAPSTVLNRGVSDAEGARDALGANYAVVGDLAASGARLNLEMSVVDTNEGHLLPDGVSVTGSRENTAAMLSASVRGLANVFDLRIQPEHLDSPQGIGSQLSLGAEQFYTAGMGYLQRRNIKGNIDNAVTQFRRAIQNDDEYAPAHAGLCEAMWRQHEETSDPQLLITAEDNCARAIELDPALPQAQIARGHVQMGRGNYEKAIRTFTVALDLEPRNADAVVGLAVALSRTPGRTDEALPTFQRAIDLAPNDWQMYHQLGRFYVRPDRRDFEAAIEPFRVVVDLTPNSARALSNLGAALAQTGRVEEAVGYFQRSAEIEPRAVAFANLGKALFDSGKYAESARRYEQAIELKPLDHGLLSDLAAAHERTEDTRAMSEYLEAARLAERALELNPRRAELYSVIAHNYAGGGDFSSADPWIEKASGRYGTAPADEAFVMAGTLARLGRVEEAKKWFHAAIERGYPAHKIRLALANTPRLRLLTDSPEYL